MIQPVVLTILDGWGYSTERSGNPFYSAKLPTFDFLMDQYPRTLIQASGQAAGLSWGEPGNSEAGHMIIGAGRTIPQYPARIDDSIKDGALKNNVLFAEIKHHVDKNGSRVHLIGLLTSGRVHASFNHLLALIDILSSLGIKNIFLHLFTDGKDSGLKEAPKLLGKLSEHILENRSVLISTIIGRNFAMDRGYNWDLTRKCFELITQKNGAEGKNLMEALYKNYEAGFNDSNIPPVFNADSDGSVGENDAILFFNFREDSMRQIFSAFTQKDFSFFPRILPANLFIVAMTRYVADDKNMRVLFQPPDIKLGLAEVLSRKGRNQLHISESEKYAHITYFFNGLNNRSQERETDIFIDSYKELEVHPEMKSREITDKIIEELERDFYDFIVVNYANADILAHSGNFNAAVGGLESLDRALSRLYTKVMQKNGVMIVTSDHGNVESLTYRGSGEKEVKHNINPVPFILIGKQFEKIKKQPLKISGILSDIAPTVLELMEIPKPEEMTGDSLLRLLQ